MRTKTNMPLLLAAWEERLAGGPEARRNKGPQRITGNEAVALNVSRGIKVSAQDEDTLQQVWHVPKDTQYPTCAFYTGGRLELIRLHLVVAQRALGVKPQEMYCDHLNGIRTDCRRENLRYVTRTDNSRNIHCYGLRAFIGPHKHRNGDKWCAKISLGVCKISWSGCGSQEEAAFRYNQLAQLFGFKTRNNITPNPLW